ncbi:protein transport protein SEC20 [Plasmodium gonderi]|uniref:Protein transport protein SEC20 n=1 Tax=Plasmodium gonderi TaxID=77519 RepID=A0A1Y1JPI5_PLAGO|nr:protein transport protein SEC20 [Plasmodium gonderi]GAW83375.1 protein transport protein SEC20 [Plasmodium gonderi]
MNKTYLPILGKKKENVENLNKINSMINQMKFIDDSLKNLFQSDHELNNHDAFLLFRGIVAKRIVHYSSLIAECKDKILCADISDEDIEDVRRQFEYHQGNVKKYKRELSTWWNKNEKNYHRICMNVFLTKRKSDNHAEHAEISEKNETDTNLKDTKQMMIEEINRMKNVRSELLESSHKLRKQDEIFNMFESKIKSSTQLIFSLKRKAQNDTRYVWYSFFFFLSVCSYIILRRLGFIRALITAIKFLLSLLLYLVKFVLGVFIFFKKDYNTRKDTNEDNDLGKGLVVIPSMSEL